MICESKHSMKKIFDDILLFHSITVSSLFLRSIKCNGDMISFSLWKKRGRNIQGMIRWHLKRIPYLLVVM